MARGTCENLSGPWKIEEAATLACSVNVSGQQEGYTDSLSASGDFTIVQPSSSCTFTYQPGPIGAGRVVQYARARVDGQITGNSVTATGGHLIPDPGVQVQESSYRSTGMLSGTTMTLTGSGLFRATQAIQGAQATISCTLASVARFSRVDSPSQPPNNPNTPITIAWTRPGGGRLQLDSAKIYLSFLNLNFLSTTASFAVRTFDLDGNELTNRQTDFQPGVNEMFHNVAVNASGMYLLTSLCATLLPSGPVLFDSYLRKLPHQESRFRTVRIPNDTLQLPAKSVSTPSAVYITGSMGSGTPKLRTMLRKYDTDLNEVWTIQLSPGPIDASVIADSDWFIRNIRSVTTEHTEI